LFKYRKKKNNSTTVFFPVVEALNHNKFGIVLPLQLKNKTAAFKQQRLLSLTPQHQKKKNILSQKSNRKKLSLY